MRTLVAAFGASRLLVVVATAWGARHSAWHALPAHPWLDGFARGSALELLNRAGAGPWPVATEKASLLFPHLSWLLSGPLRPLLGAQRAVLIAGLLLSAACCWWALLATERWGRQHTGASGAGWLLAAWPFSFALTSFQPDSLGLALSLGAFLAAERKAWWEALTLAAVACFATPLAWPTWLTLAASAGRRLETVCVGTGLTLGYVTCVAGWPLAPHPNGPALLAGGLALALTPVIQRRWGWRYGLYSLLIAGTCLAGWGRASLWLFPAFALAAAELGLGGTLVTALASSPLLAVLAYRTAQGAVP